MRKILTAVKSTMNKMNRFVNIELRNRHYTKVSTGLSLKA